MNKAFLNLFFIASFFAFFSLAHADTQTFNQSLGFGSTNTAEIIKLQNFLISNGFLHASATGRYLSLTAQAVTDFQKSKGISPMSGYFGPLTRAAANSLAVAVNPVQPSVTVNVQAVTPENNQSAVVLFGSKLIKWETNNYPKDAGVNINLLRKISDSPKNFVLIRALFVNTPNDSQEIWTPLPDETGNDLFIEVTCSSTYKFNSNCQLSGDPIKVN